MALSKKVRCINKDCDLYDIVYEIPYSMLQSIEEPVHCGTCHEETSEMLGREADREPINASQVAHIASLNRTTFWGTGEALPTS